MLLFWLTGKSILLNQHVEFSLPGERHFSCLLSLPRPLLCNHFSEMAGGRGQMAAITKSREHLVPVGKCTKELDNPVGTDNAVTLHRPTPSQAVSASAEASSSADSRHQAEVMSSSCRDSRQGSHLP